MQGSLLKTGCNQYLTIKRDIFAAVRQHWNVAGKSWKQVSKDGRYAQGEMAIGDVDAHAALRICRSTNVSPCASLVAGRYNCRGLAAPVAEHLGRAVAWDAPQHLLNMQGQAIDTGAHADRIERQPDRLG